MSLMRRAELEWSSLEASPLCWPIRPSLSLRAKKMGGVLLAGNVEGMFDKIILCFTD